MANKRFSDLPAQTDDLADDDILAISDISDLSDSPQGTSKKLRADQIVAKKLKTTTGPTVLSIGAVADGEVLKRSGGTIIGAAPGGGGIGDVIGPASATDEALARFDTTTGKLLQDSPVTVNNDGAITIPEIAAPGTPAAGKVVVYAKSDNKVYRKGEDGVEAELGGGSGSPGGSSGDIQYNNAGAFGAAPLVREDADTVGLYDTSNTAANPSRLNVYGLKNGANLERFSLYYDSVNSKYVFSVNKGGTGTLRHLEVEFDGTAFWRFHSGGTLFGLSNTDSVIAVGQGVASKLAIQFGNAGSSTGLFGESGPYLSLATNAAARLSVHDFGALLGSAGRFGFATTALGSGKTEDTAMSRAAASVVEINNGTAGGSGCLLLRGRTFANRPASPIAGMECTFTDSTTTTWGATITGGGSSTVRGWYNGTNWTVIGV